MHRDRRLLSFMYCHMFSVLFLNWDNPLVSVLFSALNSCFPIITTGEDIAKNGCLKYFYYDAKIMDFWKMLFGAQLESNTNCYPFLIVSLFSQLSLSSLAHCAQPATLCQTATVPISVPLSGLKCVITDKVTCTASVKIRWKKHTTCQTTLKHRPKRNKVPDTDCLSPQSSVQPDKLGAKVKEGNGSQWLVYWVVKENSCYENNIWNEGVLKHCVVSVYCSLITYTFKIRSNSRLII